MKLPGVLDSNVPIRRLAGIHVLLSVEWPSIAGYKRTKDAVAGTRSITLCFYIFVLVLYGRGRGAIFTGTGTGSVRPRSPSLSLVRQIGWKAGNGAPSSGSTSSKCSAQVRSLAQILN